MVEMLVQVTVEVQLPRVVVVRLQRRLITHLIKETMVVSQQPVAVVEFVHLGVIQVRDGREVD